VAVTIAGDRAANLGLYSPLRAFEQGGIFIVPQLLRHGTSVYTVSYPRPTVGFEPPTQGSSDLCARRSNHCAPRATKKKKTKKKKKKTTKKKKKKNKKKNPKNPAIILSRWQLAAQNN
jgi:hypothetical protein